MMIPTGKRDSHMCTLQVYSTLVSWFAFSLTLYFETLHHGALQTGSCNIYFNFYLILESWSNDDGHVNENGKKGNIGLNWQNNNSTRASRFFVNFFAVTARLRYENA